MQDKKYNIEVGGVKEAQKDMGNLNKTVETTEKDFKSLNKQLSDGTKELARLKLAGQEGTEAYTKLAQELGNVKDALGDARAAVNAYANDTKNLTDALDVFKTGTSVVGLFNSALVALGADGSKAEEVIKKLAAAEVALNSIQKIQSSLMNKSSGTYRLWHRLKLLIIGDTQKETAATTALATAQNASARATTLASGALKVFKAALVSTGIGALVVVVGELVAHFDDLLDSLSKVVPGLELLKRAAGGVSSEIDKSIKDTETLVASFKTGLESEVEAIKHNRDEEIRAAQQAGKAEKDIYNIKVKYQNQIIDVYKKNSKVLREKTVEDAKTVQNLASKLKEFQTDFWRTGTSGELLGFDPKKLISATQSFFYEPKVYEFEGESPQRLYEMREEFRDNWREILKDAEGFFKEHGSIVDKSTQQNLEYLSKMYHFMSLEQNEYLEKLIAAFIEDEKITKQYIATKQEQYKAEQDLLNLRIDQEKDEKKRQELLKKQQNDAKKAEAEKLREEKERRKQEEQDEKDRLERLKEDIKLEKEAFETEEGYAISKLNSISEFYNKAEEFTRAMAIKEEAIIKEYNMKKELLDRELNERLINNKELSEEQIMTLTNIYNTKKIKLDEELNQALLNNQESFIEKLNKKNDEYQQEIQEGIEARKEYILAITNEVLNTVSGITDSIFELIDANIQRSIDSIERAINSIDSMLGKVDRNINRHINRLTGYYEALSDATGEEKQDLLAYIKDQEDALNHQYDLEKQLEAEKYQREKQLQKEQAIQQKKQLQNQLIQAIITGASATLNGFNTQPFMPVGIAMGALAATLSAVQIGVIGANIGRIKYANGGLLSGPSHNDGGIPVGNTGVEVEGGEYVVNKKATAKYLPLLEQINDYGSSIKKFANGGEMNLTTGSDQTAALLSNINFNPVVAVTDINRANSRLDKVKVLSR